MRVTDCFDNISIVLFNHEVVQFLEKGANKLKEEQLKICYDITLYCSLYISESDF